MAKGSNRILGGASVVGEMPISAIKFEQYWGVRTPSELVAQVNKENASKNLPPLAPGRQIETPVTILNIDGKPTLFDGYHRTAQAIVNGQSTIPAVFKNSFIPKLEQSWRARLKEGAVNKIAASQIKSNGLFEALSRLPKAQQASAAQELAVYLRANPDSTSSSVVNMLGMLYGAK